jgi:outer membrane beta-barrel protein
LLRLRTTFCVALLLLTLAPTAQAGPLDGLPAVRNKVLLHEGRHFLTPIVGATLNDPYAQQAVLGVAWRYFSYDWLGVGVDVMGGGAFKTGLTDQINDQLSLVDKTHQVETTSLQVLLHGTIEFVPIQGKVILPGGAVARFALSAQAGFGVAFLAGDDTFEREFDSPTGGRTSLLPMFGGGIRLFPAPSFALGIDMRDYLVNRTLSTDQTGAIPESRYGHNMLLQITASFVFPQEPAVQP